MPFDETQFRRAAGAFATGVTIATTLDDANQPVGMTVNSFASVSLDPPLVLWNVRKGCHAYEAFAHSYHFAIHILRSDQQELCMDFTRPGAEKFGRVQWHGGRLGSPILEGCVAHFECRTEYRYEGGDHLIVVGRVEELADCGDIDTLVFHRGKFRELALEST
ncbi:MAG: flavin reductase family protein [Xanthomonadales bacterium]|nr:flavin reductase family protein [Xanthomonadales bacterium]